MNKVDGPLMNSPRVTPVSSPADPSFLFKHFNYADPSEKRSASRNHTYPTTWTPLSHSHFGAAQQIQTSIFQNNIVGSPGNLSSSPVSYPHIPSSPSSPSKTIAKSFRKKHIAALNIPRTPVPSPSNLPLGSPTSFLPSYMQPKFHFNSYVYSTHQDQYEADRELFLQSYMMVAEEFLLAFFDAWQSKEALLQLPIFRDSSELLMEDQLYLGVDCIRRLANESCLLNPSNVDVMPSLEGFSIGIVVQGQLKAASGIISDFGLEFVLQNDGEWYVQTMRAQ